MTSFLRRKWILVILTLIVANCTQIENLRTILRPVPKADAEITPPKADVLPDQVDPLDDTRKVIKNAGATTVAEASKITEKERKQAVQKPAKVARRDLGTTVATLGLIDKGGIWLSTPLVLDETQGRIVYLKTGKSINLRLIPNWSAVGSGSQISIAAMKVLGIPITDLAELQVFAQ